MKKKPNKQRY